MKYTKQTLDNLLAQVRQERISVQHGSPSDAEIGQGQLADLASSHLPSLIEEVLSLRGDMEHFNKVLTRPTGEFSHAQVADRVRMLMRSDIDHEMVCVLARDRIILLAEENNEQARRLSELESQLAAANARLNTPGYPLGLSRADILDVADMACRCAKREPQIIRSLLHMVDDRDEQVMEANEKLEKAEARATGLQTELATARQDLLAEFVAGTEPADISQSMKMHSEPAFGEFLRGMNAVHNTNLRWARWKAAEFGLPWPLPAAEFGFDYTNEDGSTGRPASKMPAVPTLVGDETPAEPETAENCICTEPCSTWCRSPKCAPAASLVVEKGPAGA